MNTFGLSQQPFYLSIVATTRNDNHGGDLLKRTQAFIDSVHHQATRVNLRVELIIVEWNPPADKPLLKDVLKTEYKGSTVTTRIIVVPAEVHNSYNFAKSLAMYQMTAKNVGIRRAEGEFVLCTNIDILFSDGCFDRLAKKNLKQGSYYRTNRCDVPKDVMDISDFNNQLAYCEKNIIRRMGKTRRQEAISAPSFFFKFPNVMAIMNSLLVWVWKLTHPGQFAHFTMDTVACGDFTLMHCDDWMKIDGYVELDMYSIHIDSMGLWSACALGMKQDIFPYYSSIYHIDHEDGWESDDVIKTIKFLSNKPSLDYSIVYRAGMKMVSSGTNWGLNKEDWGWANEKFDEYVFEV